MPSHTIPPISIDRSVNALFLQSPVVRSRLRIGVLIDGDTAPAFAQRVLEDIAACDFATVVCYIRNASVDPPDDRRRSLGRRLVRALLRRASWLGLSYTIYQLWVNGPKRPEPDPHQPVSCANLMRDAHVLDVVPIQNGHVDRFSTSDLATVRSLELDVLLRFGFRILRGGILDAARHGIWSFHHGDSTRYRGGPAYLWELVEHNPVSGAVLQVLSEKLDAGRVLGRAWFNTSPSLSVAENAFGPYWSTQHFVIRSLHELHSQGPAVVEEHAHAPQSYSGTRPIYRTPSNREVLGWLVPELTRRVVRRIRQRPYRWQWHIALRRCQVPLYEDSSQRALLEFRWLEGPADGFWADPFLFEHADTLWIFYEELDYATGKGVIACSQISPSGTLQNHRVALERPYHLSYPHVFAHDGAVFMVPESEQSGTIDLYRARRFPDDWVLERTLVKVRAVDSTLFQHDGRWWMLSSPMVVEGHVALTYVWSAPSLFGPWQLAAHAPLSDDVRRARGAGNVFRRGTELWRPSQDCSGRYGRALAFNRIERLAERPAETTIKVIEPEWLPSLIGTHSYNAGGGWEAIDGLFLESSSVR
jgi:hypothetical protein